MKTAVGDKKTKQMPNVKHGRAFRVKLLSFAFLPVALCVAVLPAALFFFFFCIKYVTHSGDELFKTLITLQLMRKKLLLLITFF